MARGRDIKPGFFLSDELAEVSRDARLLFAGLWTLADREGRLELRPMRIKAQVFPYDQDITPQAIEKMLGDLAGARGRFIRIYEVDSRAYVQIENFKKHQHIHPNEKPSELPAPQAVPVITGAVRELQVSSGNYALPSEPSSLLTSPSHPALLASDPDPERACSNVDAKKFTGHALLAMFGSIRSEVFPKTLPWSTARDAKGDAGSFAEMLGQDEASDVEPTMRRALEHIRDGVKGWSDPRLAKDPSFAFGAWKSGFHALREELAGCAPKAREGPTGSGSGGKPYYDPNWRQKANAG
jgi:hypothetical protein